MGNESSHEKIFASSVINRLSSEVVTELQRTVEENDDSKEDTSSLRYLMKRGAVSHRKMILKTSYKKLVVEPSVIPKTDETKRFINESLTGHFLYECLDNDERDDFIDYMTQEFIEENTDIINQGDTGDFFYLVGEGEVAFIVDREEIGSCSRGGCFGELALLYDAPRAATCRSKTDTILWKIHHDTFKKMMTEKAEHERDEIFSVLKRVPLFNNLDDDHLFKIVDALELKSYLKGQKIITKGDIGNHFYIIKEGTIKVHDIGFGDSVFTNKFFKKGGYFGEMALLSDEPRAANVTAYTDSAVWYMCKQDFCGLIGNYSNLAQSVVRMQIITSAPTFAKAGLEPREINELVRLFEEKTFEAGTTLVRAGDIITDPCFCIIEKGKARKLEKNGVVGTLIKGNHFGEETINHRWKKPESQQTIEFLEQTTLAILTKTSIESVIHSTARLGKPKSRSRALDKIGLDNLHIHRIIGCRDLRTVRFVTHKRTYKPYALKKISKRQIISQSKCDNILSEKSLLVSLADFPFTVNLIATFQDTQNIYFLYDFVPGGELFNILHNNNTNGMSLSDSLFYTACIVLCFHQLYNHRICYRNLKPENILIDDKGYVVLTGFSEAKIFTNKTFTFCGTPEYLAPEIILSKGHSHGVDHWAIGIFLYELLTSSTPFYSSNIDNVTLFKRIVKVKYTFPDNGKFTHNAKDLIKHLLVKKPSKRLGCLAEGVGGIKKHAFFGSINWNGIYSKKVESPWTPSIDTELDSMDLSHFDVYEEPEIKSVDKQLTDEEQELFINF